MHELEAPAFDRDTTVGMSGQDLVSDAGLRRAIDGLAHEDAWEPWLRELQATISWVRASDERDRATREFQQKLWEENHIAAAGQGKISVQAALDDAAFRQWLAAKSLESLPPSEDGRLRFLTTLYQELQNRINPFVDRMPHLKIFRVIAALYPEAMTTIADRGAVKKLARAMGSDSLDAVDSHLWVRNRLERLLGEPGNDASALAKRMSLPWVLYKQCVQESESRSEVASEPEPERRLLPLPAARRRRGLTPIRGLFHGVLSSLEFLRKGVTRAELIDFLRASSPDAKLHSLGLAINVMESELGVIRRDRDRYILTDSGRETLASQDSIHLADFILTRILGADHAIVALHNRTSLTPAELNDILRPVNPGWTTDFVPQAIASWLRSMGVIELDQQSRYSLTEAGREWAGRIDWEPESLPPDPEVIAPVDSDVVVRPLAEIIGVIDGIGHFPAQLVANLHAGLWSHARRHFAILTGLSGSGKTLLAREYAKAVIGHGVQRRLFTLPVQPGWYDPGALLGFTNPLRGDSYVRTPFLDFLIAAAGDPVHPYVAVLDEMNLSHPEQYMAPLLSAMETGDTIQLHTEGELYDGVPGSIPYPRNLVLIGTVNMDETTHGLSDKVLDRAYVLEFWTIDLAAYPRWGTRSITAAQENRARDVLTELMEALTPARLHFGWRVLDDVLDFLAKAAETDQALPFDAALDGVIYAKVLPKLRGEDAPRFQEALNACEQALTKFGLTSSGAKVAELRRDLAATGSARFWR
jgi:hypothetical protein